MINYIPKYLKLHEVLPKDLMYSAYSDGILWALFDPRLLYTADKLRERYGTISVNTWYAGGTLEYRGFRPPNCDVGAPLSQHRFGRALDSNFAHASAQEIREDIKQLKKQHPEGGPEYVKYITSIEDDTSWLHFAVANFNNFVVFKP